MHKIVRGEVTGGNKIGRRMGFPTANILVSDDFELQDGVYYSNVMLDGKVYHAMSYLGRKPILGGEGKRVLETNIFDFECDLYGQVIEVELLAFIRGEKRFDSFEQLGEQIAEDKINILKTIK